jgi:hypothetical protein
VVVIQFLRNRVGPAQCIEILKYSHIAWSHPCIAQTEYIQKLRLAARTLIQDRFLLPEDAERMIAEARKNAVLAVTSR